MAGAKRTAFVVDDERLIGSTLEIILINQGFNARSFVDPLEALNVAQSVSLEVLVTDVMMPGLNGIELATLIRRSHPNCKVLLLSGEDETGKLLREAAAEGQEFEVLAKPVHPTELLSKLEELLDSK